MANRNRKMAIQFREKKSKRIITKKIETRILLEYDKNTAFNAAKKWLAANHPTATFKSVGICYSE